MSSLLADVPRRQGALFGILAWVAGTIFVVPITLVSGGIVRESFLELPVAAATFSYALLHAWPVLFGFPVATLAFALAPAAILTMAGYALAIKTTEWPVRAPIRGSAVLFGYLPAAGLSLLYAGFRFQVAAGSEQAAALSNVLDPLFLSVSVAYTGIMFPLLFGGLGGYLAERRLEDS